MKKYIASLVLFALCLFFPVTVCAGNINEAEKRIVELMDATFLVDDSYYKVSEKYIQKVIDYLNRDDVDMTETEVGNYIDQFFANLKLGISEGYLTKVGEKEKTPDEETGRPGPKEDDPGRPESGQEEVTDPEIPDGAEVLDVSGKAEHVVTVREDTFKVYTESSMPSIVAANAVETAASEKEAPDDGQAADEKTNGDSSDTALEEADPEDTADLPEAGSDETDNEKANKKDYSNASPLSRNMNVGFMSLAAACMVLLVCACIVIRHRSKDRK